MSKSNETTQEAGENPDKEKTEIVGEGSNIGKENDDEEAKLEPETPQRLHSSRPFLGHTPPSPSSSAGEEGPKAFPYIDGEALTSDAIALPEEFTEAVVRRQKVAVPEHLKKSACAHCGDPRPKRRGPQCGAFDPTERKWYCYLCWRQFRQDIHDAALTNAKGENCVTCNIYVLKNQGKYMDLGETPGTENGLYCVHCWEGWVNSLPTDADWIKNRNARIAAENEVVEAREIDEQDRIQKEVVVSVTKIEEALDSCTPFEELAPKISETEELITTCVKENEDKGETR